ncbi:MAG: tRNA preQ1(34) S-adenosylmethionine ribosyltransferase-isomerase QueA [Longimicrobiales bacterium]
MADAASRASSDVALPTSAFEYSLPATLIAQHPAAQRDESRLLVLGRATGAIEHRTFRDLPDLIQPGDVVVVNESRVFPARLLGRKPTGGAAEVLLLRPSPSPSPSLSPDPDTWLALVRPGARLKAGAIIEVAADLVVHVLERTPRGARRVRLATPLPIMQALERHGHVPLPPYIERSDSAVDRDRYQTVYARVAGSVAAPTAGLHFTPAVLERIVAGGADLARVVLHVGVGTFRPVEAADPATHAMHAEWYRVDAQAAAQIAAARARGGALWAIGTTVARTLETAAGPNGDVAPAEGWTRLFIRPPYRFRAVDRMVTNFHLPRSTLLMLVSAFAGHAATMRAYHVAIEENYRFYSYGDAMAVV